MPCADVGATDQHLLPVDAPTLSATESAILETVSVCNYLTVAHISVGIRSSGVIGPSAAHVTAYTRD